MRKVIPLVLAVSMLLTGCVSMGWEASKDNAAETQPPKNVYIMAGKVDAGEKADIAAKAAARVSEINFDVGSSVKAGDVVVKFDSKDLEAQVSQMEAALNTAQANLAKAVNGSRSEQVIQAQASLDNAKLSYDRTKALFEEGAVSKQVMEAAELAYLNAQEQLNILKKDSPDNIKVLDSQVKQAQAAVELAKAQLANNVIASPVTGVVVAKNINVGEVATAGSVLISIVNTSTLNVNAYLPAGLAADIKVGRQVYAKISELPGREYSGEVSVVNSVVDSKGKSILVKVKLKDPESTLKPGMFAQIGLKK